MLFKRIWMLSRMCCCIALYTCCLFTCMPKVWLYLPARRMSDKAFHFFHTMRHIYLNTKENYSKMFSVEPILLYECPAEAPHLCRTTMTLCIITGLHAGLFSVRAFVCRALDQWTDYSRRTNMTFLRALYALFWCRIISALWCWHVWPLQSLLAMRTDVYSFMGLTMNISDRMYILYKLDILRKSWGRNVMLKWWGCGEYFTVVSILLLNTYAALLVQILPVIPCLAFPMTFLRFMSSLLVQAVVAYCLLYTYPCFPPC